MNEIAKINLTAQMSNFTVRLLYCTGADLGFRSNPLNSKKKKLYEKLAIETKTSKKRPAVEVEYPKNIYLKLFLFYRFCS